MALEKRAQNLEKVKSIDTMNRSLEVKQMHMLKQFSKKIKVDRELKHLSQTPRDHPRLTSLPPLVKDRLNLNDRKNNLKQMVKSVMDPSRKHTPKTARNGQNEKTKAM